VRMQRFNIFNQLHKGLQALLYDTALMIQQTDFTRSQEGILTVYEQAVSTDEKLDAARAMSHAYRDFMIVTLQHMSKEENILNQLLWRRYTDAEIICIEQELLARIAPEEMALYNQWMLRGLNNREIIAWLRTVKKTAVGTAFQVLLAGAERELSVLRWQKIQEGLSEGALVA